MRRTGIALLSVLALTACGSPASPPDPIAASTAPGVPPSVAPSGTVPATAATGDAPAPTTTTAAPEATSAGTTRCHTADLKVSVTTDPGGGATSHHGEFLVFTNSSGRKCTLHGYPGVSFVAGDQGTQVGAAFSRNGDSKKTITLATGAKAHATIELVTTEVYDKADCKPVRVRGYRIYPPDEKASIFVSRPQTACSATDAGVGVVQPITPGT